MKLKKYYVVSEAYGSVVPILDDGSGPEEWGSDVIEIMAKNKRDAKILGLSLWRQTHKSYSYRFFGGRDTNYENPFKGVKIYEENKESKKRKEIWICRY